MPSLEPSRFASGRPMLLAGLRRVHAFDDAATSTAAQWAAFRELGPIPGQQGTTAYGVICGADPAARTLEYMTGVEVAAFDPLPPALGRVRVLTQRYAVFAHDGHVSTLGATWDAIVRDWLPRSGCTSADAPDLEVYDARFDPRTGLGGVEIWFPIRDA